MFMKDPDSPPEVPRTPQDRINQIAIQTAGVIRAIEGLRKYMGENSAEAKTPNGERAISQQVQTIREQTALLDQYNAEIKAVTLTPDQQVFLADLTAKSMESMKALEAETTKLFGPDKTQAA